MSSSSCSETCLHRTCQPARTPPDTFHGVWVPFATPAQRVHRPARIPTSPSFRPQRFSRSRRFAPLFASWACFIPQPRPGFAFQGLSPLPSRLDSSPSRSLLDVGGACLPPAERARPRAPAPSASPSRVSSRQRSVAAAPVFSRDDTRSPPRLPAPSGFSPRALAPPSRSLRSWPWRPVPLCDPGC